MRASARARPLFLCLVALLMAPPVLPAQTSADDAEEAAADAPIPYDPDEFPLWAHDLRRAEIVALGAFPVAMIVSGLGYQLGRFAYFSIREGQASEQYAPGFLSPEGGPRYTSQERIGLVISGMVISTLVATVDHLLARRERRSD